METSSSITKCVRFMHLACVIVGWFKKKRNFIDFCGKQVPFNPGKCRTAVNVVECDFDLLGRIFILQN